MNTQPTTDARGNVVTWSTILSISIAASADPRSVRRWIDGVGVKGQVAQRIAEAARVRGIEPNTTPRCATAGDTKRRAVAAGVTPSSVARTP